MRLCLIPELILKPNVINPCKDLNKELDALFDSKSLKDFKLSLSIFNKKNTDSEEATFISTIFKQVIKVTMDEKKMMLIREGEGNHSFYLIWPLMEVVSKKVLFEVGQYKLMAIRNEIIRRNDEVLKPLSYNADGCHIATIASKSFEVSLLEISGSFSERSEGRFTKDHIKAGFGALALFQEIGHIFSFGSFETFSSVLVYFIHVMG